MRKTGLYGDNDYVTIQWPTKKDLLEMLKDIPRKIKHLKYKKSGDYFGAFQVVLSNGISSPVFNTDSTNVQNMQSCNISDYSLVKKIKGTKQNGDYYLRCLIFCKENGNQIAKIETETGKPDNENYEIIHDSEEIIGIHGFKDEDNYQQLGFIVWKPPRLWLIT